jgi:multicomponent Na+:H+ antiporter subunit E
MRYFNDETFALHLSPRLLAYLGWMTKQILYSSLEVSRVVLNPRLPISTRVVEVDAIALRPVDQVILGNSITLTPGTLAIDVHRGVIKVHCLTHEGAVALMSGEMYSRVVALRRD